MTPRIAAALSAVVAAFGIHLSRVQAAPGNADKASVVVTNTDEVRACAPQSIGNDNGFLVGTGGGLVLTNRRGDAKQVWTMVDGLPATRIDAVETVNGTTWVGTEKGAAAVEIKDGALTVRKTIGKAAVHDFIAFGGRTYAATEQGVIVEDTATAIAMQGGNARLRNNVSSLAVAGGRLYAGTAAGLYRLDGSTLVRVTYAPPANPPGVATAATPDPGAMEITSLHGDGARLWIATVGGLFAYENGSVTVLGGGEVRRVTSLGGKLAVAGIGTGVRVLDRGRFVPRAEVQDLKLTQVLVEDSAGACAGGLDGLWVRSDAGWAHPTPASGIPGNDVSALAVDGDALWVGMFDHGVARYANGTWMRIASERLDRRVNALLVDKTKLWVATATGVSTIEMTSATTYNVTELGKADGLPARGVLSLAKMKDGRVLAGTMQGAVILGDGRPRPLNIKQGLNVTNVWAVTEDTRGDIWLGTTTGLYRGRADDAKWTRYAVATGELKDDWVMALTVDPTSGAVFAGTYKGGVVRFDVTSDPKPVVTQLGGGWINPSGLAWRDGVLHAATMEGLLVGDGTTAKWTTTMYTARDTTASARIGKRTWVASRRGIVAI